MFLLLKGDLSNRLDPYYYKIEFLELSKLLKNKKYNFQELSKISKKIFSGTTPLSGGDAYTNQLDGIPFVRSGDYNEQNEIIFEDLNYVKPDIHNKLMKGSQLQKNDILIAIVGATIGKVGIYKYDFEANINQAIGVIRLNEGINPDFVQVFLLTKTGQKIIDRLKRPVARANINLEELGTIAIPILPKETQQNIINIFEQANAIKKTNENQVKVLIASIDDYLLSDLGITLPDSQENSLRNRVFLRNINELSKGRFDGYYYGEFFERFHTALENGDYPLSQLDSLCSKITDGTHYTPTYMQEGVKFISVKNVRRSKITFDNVKYITKEEHLILTKRAKPEPNDILLTKIGTIGLACVIENGLPEFSIFVSLALLKPIDTINPYFLSEVINSPIVTKQFERDLKGTGVPDLHLENIRKVLIPIPPVEIQEKIVVEIRRIREQIKTLQNEAKEILEQAKAEVERMILGE